MLNHLQDVEVLTAITARLWELYELVRSIQMGVRTDDGSKQARYQIPRALPAAFQHLVMLLVVSSTVSDWSEHSWNQLQTAFDECEGLLIEGRKQLILMIHTDDYRESAGFQAVDSEALLSLVLANLISHLSTEREFHLTEVYSEYTTRIHRLVRDSASVKSTTISSSCAKNSTSLKTPSSNKKRPYATSDPQSTTPTASPASASQS